MSVNLKPTVETATLAVVLNLACFVAMGLRFLAKSRIRRPMKLHDWLCITSLVFCVGYSIVMVYGTAHGDIGKHITDVPLDRLTVSLKSFFASQFFWAFSITTFRLSILFVYIDVFSVGTFCYYAYAMVGMVCLFFIGSLTTTLRLCQPIQFTWDRTIVGTCGDIGLAELVAAALNLVFDVIIVLLPLPLVWGLKMDRQKKIGLTITFALSLVISAINLGRIIQVKLCDPLDFTYCTHAAVLLTIPEMAVGIIVATIPLLGPVMSPARYKQPKPASYGTSYRTGSSSIASKTGKDSMSNSSVGGNDYPTWDVEQASSRANNKAWAKSIVSSSLEIPASSETSHGIGVEKSFKVSVKP